MITRTKRRIGIITGAVASIGLTAGLVTPMTAHADAKNACSGIDKPCKIVAHADVTGDGRADFVGIVMQETSGSNVTRYQVRVRTAGGKLVRKTDKHAGWYGDPFHGAANIDGRRGKDLVVGHVAGAHGASYRVYTYHNGKLVLLKAPKLPKKVAATNDRSWFVDAAVASFAGIRRTTPHGHVVITDTSGSRDPSAPRYTGWKLKYRWDDNHWELLSAKHRTFTNKQAAKVEGWHVKGVHN